METKSVYTVSLDGEAVTENISPTSARKKSKTTQTDCDDTNQKLEMLQTVLAMPISGVQMLATTIFHEGHQTAAVILVGCYWQDGRLVLANGGLNA